MSNLFCSRSFFVIPILGGLVYLFSLHTLYAQESVFPPTPVTPLSLTFQGPVQSGLLTREELLKDVETLKYLVETAYAGYEPLRIRGYNFETRWQVLKSHIISPMGASSFARIIVESLAGLPDSHFGLVSDSKLYNTVTYTKLYTSAIVLERKDGILQVKTSNQPEISPGEVYLGTKENLFPLYVGPDRVEYRLGVLSETPVHEVDIDFTTGMKKVQLNSPIRISSSGRMVKKRIVGEVVYFSLRSFLGQSHHSILEAWVKLAPEFRDFKTLILDVRGNPGGNDNYAKEFMRNLTGKSLEVKDRKTSYVVSPAVIDYYRNLLKMNPSHPYAEFLQGFVDREVELMGSSPTKVWVPETSLFTSTTVQPPVHPMEDFIPFQGNILLIVDQDTGSAAESLVPVLKTLDKVVVLGTNTNGVQEFGNVLTYRLPSSGLPINLAMNWIEQGSDYHGEGKGFYPDWWAPRPEDLEKALTILTGVDAHVLLD